MSLSDKKFNIKWHTKYGRAYRAFLTGIGVILMRMARRIFAYTLGRCSWCGRDCGFQSVINKKGMRCMHHECSKV